MAVNRATVNSILTSAFACAAIWMTIATLSDGSKAFVVGGGWACFVVAAVVGFVFWTAFHGRRAEAG